MKTKHFYIRLDNEHLQQDEVLLNSFLQSVTVTQTAAHFSPSGNSGFWSILVFYDELPDTEEQQTRKRDKKPPYDPSILSEEEKSRYEALRVWRAATAQKVNVANFIIASNAVLGAIAQSNPTTKEELYNVKGLGEMKIEKYGEDILEVLNSI